MYIYFLQFAQPEGDDKTLCVDEWPFLQTEFCEVKEWGKKRASCNNVMFGFCCLYVAQQYTGVHNTMFVTVLNKLH